MREFGWSRRGLITAATALGAGRAVAEPARPDAPGPTAPAAPETLKSILDQSHRLMTEVFIDGQGPFLFLVDTGADHSVVTREMAITLGLPAGPEVVVHGVAGDVVVPSAFVTEFRVGSRRLRRVALPLLVEGNVGAAGVLGIDVLQDQRVVIDFRGGRIVISDSPPTGGAFDEVVVKARSRFGQLVLVDSSLDDQAILVVVDTGAENSIANLAFERHMRSETAERANEITAIYSVTGQSIAGRWAVIPSMRVGGFRMRHVPVVFSELRSFERWRLQNQPALLLGMDVLRLFDRVEIDFARREVHFAGLHAQEEGPDPYRVRLARRFALPPQA
jgi:predicted aspartyl protease